MLAPHDAIRGAQSCGLQEMKVNEKPCVQSDLAQRVSISAHHTFHTRHLGLRAKKNNANQRTYMSKYE